MDKRIGERKDNSRAKYALDDSLKYFIDLANLFLFKIKLPEVSEFEEKVRKEAKPGELFHLLKSNEEKIRIAYTVILDLVNTPAKDLITELVDEAGHYAGEKFNADIRMSAKMASIFIDLYEIKLNDIKTLIDLAKSLNQTKPNEELSLLPVLIWMFPIVQEDNTLKFYSQSSLLETLTGIKVDRLRNCKKCGRIFWASRHDSYTCSVRCNTALRVYLSRNLTDEEKAERKIVRNEQRRANEEYKKSKNTKSKK